MSQEAVEFDGDDSAYLDWLSRHPDGYVINTPRSRTPGYMMLHRADCPTIGRYTAMAKRGGFTERDYIKICAASISVLKAWVRQHGRSDGTFSGKCGICQP